jgi:hypothetical protein
LSELSTPWPATGTAGSSGRRGELGDALQRGRAHQRDPQPAVGGEALLRGEVVGVGLGRVDGQAAGAGGGVDDDELAVGRRRGPHDGHGDPVEVSLCAQARTSQVGSACGSGALPGSARTTTGSARKGAPRVDSANFAENSP